MEKANPIIISDKEQIDGNHPIVVIGPNGSGKTKFGVYLADVNNADLIGAVRKIQLEENIPMRSVDLARTDLSNTLKRRRKRYWETSNEIDELFSKLLGEDSQSAIKFRDDYGKNVEVKPERTKIMVLSELWAELFPGRAIDFTSYSPKVRASHAEYLAQQMSDGERVAVYLAGRVLDSDKDIIIIDEPEVHFHNRLAVQFWNNLEEIRPECRFVYITHDLTFALSRLHAQYLIIQPDKPPESVPLDSTLPPSIMQSILSAASFSIYAHRIVFCEGADKGKRDHAFYSSWFNSTDTAVIPVGSCEEVIQCTVAFENSRVVAGVTALGIIDRDYKPDDYFSSLPSEVHPLPTHEIENLYCLRGVFEAIGKYISLSSQQIDDGYSKFIQEARALFTGGLLCKQVSERFKSRYHRQVSAVLNTLTMLDDLDKLKSQHTEAMNTGNSSIDPASIFNEESKLIQDALTLDDDTFLKLLPGKNFYSIAAKMLGLDPERYTKLVHSALAAESGSKLWETGQALEKALVSLLPSRYVTEPDT